MQTPQPSTILSGSATSLVSIENLFSSNPRQIEAWKAVSEKRFVLYGGQAGGGKSFFLRWWAVAYLICLAEDGVPKAQVGLFCEDYPSLKDRQISKIEMEFPRELGTLRQGESREFVLHDKFGGGKILLRNLDDPSKYLSAEFAGIGVDELTRNHLEMFDFLRMRLRWPGVTRPRFVGTTNPGGIGHSWVKNLWIKREYPRELKPLADEFVFISARASDNPYLSESYRDELSTLPPAMAKAYAEGSWDVFAGQYFDVFDKEKHVRFADKNSLQPWTSRWISIDWGFAHDAAVQWHATIAPGKHVTYRELVKNELTPRQLAEEIIKANSDEEISNVYLSPDAFARRTNFETIASQIEEEFLRVGLPSPEPADNDRVGGWMLMYSLLGSGEWTIDPRCPRLIEGLQAMTRDTPDHPEDCVKAPGDDSADCARYGIKSRLSLAPVPREVRIAEQVNSADMSIKMLQQRKAELEIESADPRPVRRNFPIQRRWSRN